MSVLPRLALAGAVAAVLGPVPAAATDDPVEIRTWAVVTAGEDGPDGRGVFSYVVEPGDVYEDFVAVRNLGTQPITLVLHAHDARQTVANDFEVLTPEEEAVGIGAWLELAETEVTVEPRGHVVVPFVIDLPLDAEPGDHAGAILAVAEVADGPNAVQYRAGTRVHLRIGGPMEPGLRVEGVNGAFEASVSPLARGDLTAGATLVNTGNVRLEPEVSVEIRGLFGWGRRTTEVTDLPELLPDAATSLTAAFEDVLPMGPVWLTFRVDRATSAGQDVTMLLGGAEATTLVWALSWPLVVAVALLLTALVLAIRNLVARRRIKKAGGTVGGRHKRGSARKAAAGAGAAEAGPQAEMRPDPSALPSGPVAANGSTAVEPPSGGPPSVTKENP